jgi:hypothetical protein
MDAYKSLVKFWREYPACAVRGLHPADTPAIKREQTLYFSGIKDYVKSEHFGNETGLFHTGFVPGPYCGDLQNARVYFLMLNPGFSPRGYHDQDDPDYRAAMVSALTQKKTAYPFFPLNPAFCWAGAAEYWLAKLKPLFEKYQGRGESYHKTAAVLSRNIASLELFPYHSSGFKMNKKLLKMESVAFMRDYARNIAADKNKLLIVMRQCEAWGINEADNVILLEPAERRKASIRRYADPIISYIGG